MCLKTTILGALAALSVCTTARGQDHPDGNSVPVSVSDATLVGPAPRSAWVCNRKYFDGADYPPFCVVAKYIDATKEQEFFADHQDPDMVTMVCRLFPQGSGFTPFVPRKNREEYCKTGSVR